MMVTSLKSHKQIEATMEMSAVNKLANIWGTIALIILCIPYIFIWDIGDFEFVFLLKVLANYIVFIVLHELLHLAGFIFIGEAKLKDVKLGINWKAAMPYAHCKIPLQMHHYRLAVLLPIILGIGPLIYAYLFGSGLYFVIGILMTVGSFGDLIVLKMLRNYQKDTYVKDHPSKIGCIVFVPER